MFFLIRNLAPIFAMLGLASILAGCPPQPATTLNANPAVLNFTLADVSKSFRVDIANGSLDWTASDNQPWLNIAPANGNADGTITVTVDRAQMDTTQANSGTVTVTAGTLTDTVNVTVEADPPLADVSDLLAEDLAAVDTDGDGRVSFTEAQADLPGLTQTLFDGIDDNGDGFLSDRELAAGGGEVDLTPIDTAYFPMAVGNSWTYAFGEYGNSLGANSLRLSVAEQLEVAGHDVWRVDLSLPGLSTGVPLFKGLDSDDITGDNPAIPTYWVFVEGTWYAALSLDVLDELPDTSQLLPIGKVLRWPTSLAYLQSSGLLESASNEITGIVALAAQDFDANSEALYSYLNAVYSGDTEAAFALFLAFGNEFTGYESGDPSADALVQLLADLGIALEPITVFFERLSVILQDMSTELSEIEEMPVSLPFWTAWEETFGKTYVNDDLVIQGSVRVLTQIAYELALHHDAEASYSEDDLDAYNVYLSELFYAVEENVGLLTADPAAFVDLVQAFATEYESESPAVEAAVGATLNVLEAVEALLPALEEHMPFPLNLAGLETFLGEGTDFATAYTETNGADPAAAFVSVLLGGAQALVDELEVVAPNVNAIAADLEDLETQATSSLIPRFDFATYAKVFGDFESFFETYGETETDALATALGIGTGAVSGTLDVVAGLAEEVAKVPFEEFAGNLESLLPTVPDFPLPRGLEDFGIPDRADCIAQGVEFNLEDEVYTITSTIYTRDLGPAMLFFLPLQYAVVDGEFVGTISTGDIAFELSEVFDAADTDGDEVLSLAEAQATLPGVSELAFAELDTDSDGSLTLHEVQIFGSGADAYETDDEMEEASPIAAGETQSHNFHNYYDIDWVVVEVTDPVTVTLNAASETGYIYFYLDLYDSDGNGLASADGDEVSLAHSIYTPGFYFIRVGNYDVDETLENAYTLHLEEMPAPELVLDSFEVDDSPEQASPIAVDEVQDRTFHVSNDQDWVAIEVTEPTTLSLRGESETGEVYFYIDLYDASINWLASVEGYSEALTYIFDTPGTYYALVSTEYVDELTGNAYTLSLEQIPTPDPDSFEVDDSPGQASSIAVDEVQSRNFHVSNDQDWAVIEVTDATTLTMTTQNLASDLDTTLTLFDGEMSELAYNDDDQGLESRIDHTFETPGTYYLLAAPLSGANPGATYELTVVQGN